MKGKAKEDFEEWYLIEYPPVHLDNESIREAIINWFYSNEFSMQFGVIEDFFDSVGIEIKISCSFWQIYMLDEIHGEDVKSRLEAREAAIKKACEIYNNK